MGTLNFYTKVVAFEDTAVTNNPSLRSVDWSRKLEGIQALNGGSKSYTIPALGSLTIFNGARTLGYDVTTEFSLALLTNASNRYRLTWTGTGTDPVFRTARAVAVSPGDLVFAVQSNQSVTVTSSLGSVFGDVEVGDEVFIPGLSTGDSAGSFSDLNEGYWSVLDATATQLTLARFTGTIFSGYSETVTVADDAEFMVYSAAGIQIDDVLDLVSGFPQASLHSYEIVAVTSTFIEFVSGYILPQGTYTPGVGSLVVYTDGKQFIYIESDQEVVIKFNGSTESTLRLEPILAGDPYKPGVHVHTGTVYSLVLQNRSPRTAQVRVISAE